MERLTIFNVDYKVDEEVEMFGKDLVFGMDIFIKYKLDISKPWAGLVECRHNCTEFHHLYNIKEKADFEEPSSAFESDIHYTGGTKNVNQIEWIIVQRANGITKTNRNYEKRMR